MQELSLSSRFTSVLTFFGLAIAELYLLLGSELQRGGCLGPVVLSVGD